MRVMMISQKPQTRGAELFGQQLANWYRAQGHAATSLFLYPDSEDGDLPLHPDDVVLDGAEWHPFERFPTVHPVLLHQTDQAIARFAPDIVQLNGARPVKYGALLKRLRPDAHWRTVYRNIGSPLHWNPNPLVQVYYRQLFQGIDGIIGISERTLREVHQVYRRNCPTTCIPNAIDTARLDAAGHESGRALRRKLGIGDHDPVLLFVGQLTERKRPDVFVDVASRVLQHQATAHAWLVGDGPQREDVTRLASASPAASRIRLWGARHDIAPFYRAASVLVVTSDTEGVPGVVLEAGYMETPTIGYDVGGIAEAVHDGKTGRLVPHGDSDALAATILESLQSGEQLQTYGRAACARVKDQFVMSAVAPRYHAFYQELLQ